MKRNTAFLLIAAIIIVISAVLILAPQSVQNLIGQVALVFASMSPQPFVP